MNITQKLMDEHQLILAYTRLLEGYIMALKEDSTRTVLSARLPDFIPFVREYADRYHHAKEENVLFKFMEKPGVLTHCNPLPQMNYEHEEGRKYIRGMQESLQQGDVNTALRYAYGWLQLLRDHISKEDNILYPMAEEGVPQSERAELIAQYQNAEDELQGEKLEKKYQDLFQELKALLEKNSSRTVSLEA